uniref:Ubiquitin-like domain-containing protein n=1 Tax=Corethron hystrix TaxID=216773 RepID=A0A6U5DVG0_9STRA|mmetsp:Transcript_14438/g.31685  ORF Transcript_14438/g.31685 Transcript_14438/m.31685 type:complete len:686 (+) Transcript_14438:448-2505(+)
MNEEKTTPSSPDGQYLSKLPADNPAADSDPATDSDSDTSPPAAPLPPALPWILSVKVVGPPTDLLPPSSSSPVPSLSPRTNDGTTTFDIDVDPEAEISVLRRAIEARTGLSPERQRLIFRGRLLPQHAAGSTERVRDVCGLGNGMVIHLVPRPAGSCEATAETAVTTTAGAVRVEGSTSGSSETSGVTDSTGELILSIDDILGALSIPDMLASANPGGGTTFQAANIPGGASGIVVMGGMGGMGDGAVAFREIANSIPQAAGGDAPTVPPHPSGAAEENVPGNTAASRGRRLLRILRGGGRSSPRPSPEIANGGPRPSPVPAPPTAGGLSGRLFSASNALRRMSGTGSSEAIVTEGEMAGAPSPMPGLVFPTVTGTGGRPTPPSLDALRSAFAVAAHQAEGGMAAAAGAALARVEVPEDLGSPSLGLPARRHSIGGGERRESRGPQPYVPEGAHSLEHIRQGLMSIHTILGEVEGRRLQEEEGEGVEVVLAEESGEESASANTNTTTGIPTPTRSRQFDVPRRRYYRGQWIDCRDTVNQWLEATVVDVISPELLVNPPANASPPPYASRSVRQLSTSESFRLDARDPTVAAGDLAGRTRLLYRPATDAAGIAERLEAGEELQSEEVLATADDVDLLLVHYNGWPSRWDEWIRSDSDRVRPFRSRTRHQRNVSTLFSSSLEPLFCC